MATDTGVAPEGVGKIHVEVAFALPHEQRIVSLEVEPGTTARQAVLQATLDALFPGVPDDTFREAALGIFGTALRDPEHHELRAGDRVEVYRPLIIDPKVARAERAAKGAKR
ncbi:RnfH family protein [Halomonas binhaiensis]|uniref:UPF0125 protein E4T21_19125 n=1 Tax=Halomonas binhaiensis TaxID=2562282 RepID=A0A5C1NIA1_9GAMM|nr:RnfH family protein [Halomonas binhaiensis]QEM83432.1 RnfH family protein [Halomonas binhaiensis]